MFKRGDRVILNLGKNVGKPRPAVIIQNDILNSTLDTTVVMPLTSDIQPGDTFRCTIQESKSSGLTCDSQVMIEKISQIPVDKISKKIGKLTKTQIVRIETRLFTVLGIK